MPHSVSCSPAGMVWTGELHRDPQRPPTPVEVEVAGKDWERVMAGAWAGKPKSLLGWEESGGRVGEVEVVVVVVVRLPAEPIQQEVKGWRRRKSGLGIGVCVDVLKN